MMLKSLIVDRTGTAFDEERGFSYTFDTCLRLAAEQLGLIDKDQRQFVSMLDNLRDSAMHYYQEISEPMLYIFAQASVSLFNDLIRKTTGKGLLDYLPGRVLPICSIPPQQLGRVLDEEFTRLRELLQQPDLPKQRAIAMLRPLMAFKINPAEQQRRMTPAELEVALENLSAAESWRVAFPEIAKVEFTSDGDGMAIGFKVVKESVDARPVRVLKPGDPEPPEGFIIQKEINLFDKFSMGLDDLAPKVGVSRWRILAMIREYAIEADSECFRIIPVGSGQYKRYSKKTLDMLREKRDAADECWRKHKYALTHKQGKKK